MNKTRHNSYCQNKYKSKDVKSKKHCGKPLFNLMKGWVRQRAEREMERKRELSLCRENDLFIIRHTLHEWVLHFHSCLPPFSKAALYKYHQLVSWVKDRDCETDTSLEHNSRKRPSLKSDHNYSSRSDPTMRSLQSNSTHSCVVNFSSPTLKQDNHFTAQSVLNIFHLNLAKSNSQFKLMLFAELKRTYFEECW